jgi:hypothetical protein
LEPFSSFFLKKKTIAIDLFAEYPTKLSDDHPRLTNFTNQLERDERDEKPPLGGGTPEKVFALLTRSKKSLKHKDTSSEHK